MTKNEFLTLQEEDIKTLDNSVYNAILELFKQYIPNSADIKENKSVAGMYDFMYDFAKKNQKDNCCCIDPFDGFKKLMLEYLELKDIKESNFKIEVSLEDIFS